MKPKLSAIVFVTVISLSACAPYQAKAIAEGFIDCRVHFDTAFKTLAAAASSLSAQKRLELLIEAVETRRKCEDHVVKNQS